MLISGEDSDGNKVYPPMQLFAYEDVEDALAAIIVDAATHGLVTMASEHHAIHEGVYFNVCHRFTDIADDASVSMLVRIASGYRWDVVRTLLVDGKSAMSSYDGPTSSDDGTPLVLRNRHRGFADAPTGVNVWHTPTVSVNGTEFCPLYVPAGEKKTTGGGHRSAEEVVLVAGDYLFEITNESGEAEDIYLSLEGYIRTV